MKGLRESVYTIKDIPVRLSYNNNYIIRFSDLYAQSIIEDTNVINILEEVIYYNELDTTPILVVNKYKFMNDIDYCNEVYSLINLYPLQFNKSLNEGIIDWIGKVAHNTVDRGLTNVIDTTANTFNKAYNNATAQNIDNRGFVQKLGDTLDNLTSIPIIGGIIGNKINKMASQENLDKMKAKAMNFAADKAENAIVKKLENGGAQKVADAIVGGTKTIQNTTDATANGIKNKMGFMSNLWNGFKNTLGLAK